MRPADPIRRSVFYVECREKFIVIGRIHLKAEIDFFQLGGAFDLFGPVPGFAQRRQQHSRQNSDDGNNDQVTDSVETAFFEGSGQCMLRFYDTKDTTLHTFSNRFEADGIQFEEPTENLFSFNSPVGACPKCEGFGRIIGIDESLVIPNRALSVYDGAVVCWRGDKMNEWKDDFILHAQEHDFPIFTPYYQLTHRDHIP